MQKVTKNISWLILIMLANLHVVALIAQPVGDAANYSYSNGSNESLVDMSTGTTELLGSGIIADEANAASAVTDIGFDVWFFGEYFNQFSVTPNGILKFGSEQINVDANTPSIDTAEPIGLQARLAPLTSASTDFATSVAPADKVGKVHYKVIGTFPNRVLVVEWNNIEINRYSTRDNNATFQAHIYETAIGSTNGGEIYFVYGRMNSGPRDEDGDRIDITTRTGIGYGETGNKDYISINTTTTDLTASRTAVFDNLLSGNDSRIDALHSGNNNTQRVFMRFAPNAASGEISNPTATCLSPYSANLSWTDPATSNGYYVAVYRATDNSSDANFEYVGQAPLNSETYSDAGLTPNTTYYYRFYIVNEGDLSEPASNPDIEVEITMPLDPGTAVYATDNGNWSDASKWSKGALPTATDNIVIPCGITVNLDTDGICNELFIQSGSGITFDDNGRTLTLNGDLTNEGTVDLQGTGTSLRVNGDVNNTGNWISGEATVTFSGTSLQTVSNTGKSYANIFDSQTSDASSVASYALTTIPIEVSGLTGTISEVSVDVEILHAYISDVILVLVSPSGTSSTLFLDNDDYGYTECGEDNMKVTFDDDATLSASVNSECVSDREYAIEGTYQPEDALSGFDTEDPNGLWTLRVYDSDAVDKGFLADVQVNIETTAGSGSFGYTDGNLTFYDLVVNNTGGGVAFANTDIRIHNSNTLTNGLVDFGGDYEMTFENGATTTIATNSSYVNGLVRKIGDDQFGFPVGNGGWAANIGITAPTSRVSQFTAQYFRTSPNSNWSIESKAGTINNVSDCEYWLLERPVGTSEVRLALSYDNTRSCGVPDPSTLLVTHWTGTIWEDKGISGTASPFGFASILSDVTFTSFSPITLGNTGINPLPVELMSFEAREQEDGVLVEWSTIQEVNSSHFVIERSSNGTDFEEVGKVEAQGYSNATISYDWLDEEVKSQATGSFYYRLKSVDMDESYDYSRVKQVEWSAGVAAFSWNTVYPNPFAEELSMSLSVPQEGQVQYEIIDPVGRTVMSGDKGVGAGLQDLEIPNVSQLSKGLYLLKVTYNDVSIVKKIVKE